MTYVIVLSIALLACAVVLAVTRIAEQVSWRRCDRREGAAPRRAAFDDTPLGHARSWQPDGMPHETTDDDRPRGHCRFAVRLPLWVATLGIAVCVTTIGVAVGMRGDDGELSIPHMIALTPLFVAGAVMVLTPSAGFHDIEADRRGPGYLTFRRFYLLRRRVPLNQVRYCLMRGGAMELYVPGRTRPFTADQSMHGYGRLLGLMARNDVPIFWQSLSYEDQRAA